jgi:hypothetical protein
MRNVFNILVGKSEDRNRPGRRWDDSIIKDLREIGWGGVDRVHLTQEMDKYWALLNMIMSLRVP